MNNSTSNLTNRVLKELTPGTLFRGFFLTGFDPTDGRLWYFNFEDENRTLREMNSSTYYPSLIRYFKTPIERLEPLSLSFTEGSELGMIFEVAELESLDSKVALWFASRVSTKMRRNVLAVQCYLIESNCVATFLIQIDEAKGKVHII